MKGNQSEHNLLLNFHDFCWNISDGKLCCWILDVFLLALMKQILKYAHWKTYKFEGQHSAIFWSSSYVYLIVFLHVIFQTTNECINAGTRAWMFYSRCVFTFISLVELSIRWKEDWKCQWHCFPVKSTGIPWRFSHPGVLCLWEEWESSC